MLEGRPESTLNSGTDLVEVSVVLSESDIRLNDREWGLQGSWRESFRKTARFVFCSSSNVPFSTMASYSATVSLSAVLIFTSFDRQ